MPPLPAFILADTERRPRTLEGLVGDAPLVLAFVERDCPTCVGTLSALVGTGARFAVVSEGTAEAAHYLIDRCGLDDVPVLIESAPYPVSEAYGLTTIPTLLLLDAQANEVERCIGWDVEVVRRFVTAAGGRAELLRSEMPEIKPGCMARNTYDASMQQVLEDGDAEYSGEDHIDEMWRRGWHDGLPVVPPTHRRVQAMLGGRDGSCELGSVPPKLGLLTLERLAACAVLAGCEPAHFPVVIAAAEAVMDPAFNLQGVQNTTHFAAPVVVVNGPIARELGMNAGSNALGFGNRANSTIGRALRLMMCLTGGGTPGGLDQSALGGPHKRTFCFPENEASSPWPPLHVDLGYAPETSTVTVVTGEGPIGISDHYSHTPEQLATTMALAMGNVFSPTWYPVRAHTLLLVCTEHARSFATWGWSKEQLREWIYAHARRTVGDLRNSGTGELTPEVREATDPSAEVAKFSRPDEIMIAVVGGEGGRFSAAVGPWVGYETGSIPVTRVVQS